MAITISGSISLDSVIILQTTPSLIYQIYVNVVASSPHPINRRVIYYDGIVVSDNPIPAAPPIYNYGTIATPQIVGVAANSTGNHLVEIELYNTNGDSSAKMSLPLYLDVVSPTINQFDLHKISLSGGNFNVEFNVDVEDDAGISEITLRRTDDLPGAIPESYSIGLTQITDVKSIIVPNIFPNNTTKNFDLVVKDFSGNQITSAPYPVTFVSVSPNITNLSITSIVQTPTDYEINTQIDCSFGTFQDINAFSCEFMSLTPVWQPFYATGGTASIAGQVIIPKSTPAGTYKITAYIQDNFGNISALSDISFDLDKLDPIGNIHMDYAEKLGTPPFHSYYANLHFTASDAGLITHYTYSDIGPSDLVNHWTSVPTPGVNFSHRMTYNIGQTGSKVMYVKYRDLSGNESPVYTELMSVDTSIPTANFSFVEGELRGDGDYDAHFDIIASDNDKLKSISFFGANSVSNIHSNNFIDITEVGSISERRSLIIPTSELEAPIDFYFQVRDRYGNESALRHEQVQFDKNPPNINSISYTDVTKFPTEYRIHAEFEADDNFGITAYRFGFGNDLSTAPWVATSKTTNLTKEIYLDVQVPAELNVSKPFSVQVKDAFGNESNIVNTVIQVNDVPPTGGFTFAGSTLLPMDYQLNFDLTGQDLDPTDNVHWYSLIADDPLLTDWKQLSPPNNVISETVSLLMPRTSSGRHDFYLKLADKYKNESPIYSMQVDLDAITVVGSISLNSVSKSGASYTANVLLEALDNNYIHSYIIKDSESGNVPVEHNILPPVQVFHKHITIPIGTIAGPRTANVQYKDAFGNLSDDYSIAYNLDTTDPAATAYFSGLTSNTTHRDFYYDLNMTDNQELYAYKFWCNLIEPEPTDWIEIPRSNTVSISKVFTLSKMAVNPTFLWKVKDFFGNEISNSDSRTITTLPPATTLSLNSISYSTSSINVGVDYTMTAMMGSQVDKFDVDVNSGLHTETVNLYPNAPVKTGTYYYEYPLNTPQSDISIWAWSDYGYKAATAATLTTTFDSTRPVIANTSFEGNFGLGSNFVLRIHIEGSDAASGIRKIILEDPAGHIANIEQIISQTHTVDEIFEFVIPGTYPTNTISPTVYLEDLLGNISTGNTIPSVHLDSVGPTISNVVINFNQQYTSTLFPSPAIGSNKQMVDVSFDAQDYSDITHYHYSPSYPPVFNSATWTSVPANQKTISISETIDLDSLGFINEDIGVFHLYVRDRFTKISSFGAPFEYDRTPPVSTLTFSGRIEREMIGAVDHFVIPYQFDYTSNYATVLYKKENTPVGGINSNILQTLLPIEETSNSYIESYKIPVANYGPTKINVSVLDRFQQQSANSAFTVILENNPPTINSVVINNGANYTNDKDVIVRMDMADDIGVTQYLIANSEHLQWDDPDWQVIPNSPATALIQSFNVDLEAIGFGQGTCNVYSYVKDFCQNVANTKQVIVYDSVGPTAYNMTVNTWTRTATTYDILLDVYAYDETSGLDNYYISQNKNETVYTPVPGRPVIGSLTSNTHFQKTEQVSVRDVGKKWFYFQATDMAGNISNQAKTYFYIDSVAPVAATFHPSPDPAKYYLNAVSNTFAYAISDDYKLASAGYQIDGQNVIPFKSYVMGETTDTGTFSANFTTLADGNPLTDGEHTIFLTVHDTYDNSVRVPYEFVYDNTPPTLTLSILEIEPRTRPTATTFDVELLIQADDAIALDYYEIYDNGSLVATVPVLDKHIRVSPTIEVNLTSLLTSTLDVQLVLLEDDVLSASKEVYALVKGFSPGDETKVKNIVSSITGAAKSTFMAVTEIETNINNFNRSSNPSLATLAQQVGLDPITAFMNGSYTILRLEKTSYSSGTPVPDSELISFMRTAGYTSFVETTPSSAYGQYNRVIVSPIIPNASSDTEVHDFEVRVYDKAGNMVSDTVRQYFHDGSNLSVSNFIVAGSSSIARTFYSTETFDADFSSKVNLTHSALTIHSSIDFDSSLWLPISNVKTLPYTANFSLSDFALSSIHDDIYLHIKDENGHMTKASVNILMTVQEPDIKNISSPIILTRQGNYYVGTITFDIESKP